ncbi:metal ABC transporter permease [Corynebacterium vitaeruminis]|uniref:metal ABC transporter permease n=1 Tax=Corynebacterium vitaeruminis TaxID=38305 RepID=UPI00046CEFE1|nr:metal ABC transporter permease [Corynebacterium vitaeruminis]
MSVIDFLAEFSYRRTLFGTMAIGATCGAMGTFLYLRRQALMSDVIGHAATPGVMAAFLLVSLLAPGADPRALPVLVVGALVSGLASVWLSQAIARHTRIGIDATMAVVLSLFLGGGLVILQVIQKSTLPGKGGIQDLMFGNAATLTSLDVATIAVSSVIILAVAGLCWRPFVLMTFDETEARIQGWPVRWLTPALFGLLVVAIVMGVKAVGLILMIAFAVFPPAAARQFTRTTLAMFVLSGAIGAAAAAIGSYLSIALGNVPTGPVIVVVLGAFIGVSMLAGSRTGVRA